MQMHLWRLGQLEVHAPASIAGAYEVGTAAFGAALQPEGVTGDVVLTVPADACAPLTNGPLTGKIALIDRGDCFFVEKVAAAQAADAAAVIVTNNVPNGLIDMAGEDPALIIPAVFITLEDGNLIKGQLPGVNATISGYLRDADLDNGIIIHEYGHGVSNRRTGGPGSSSCLDSVHGGGLGEGGSDWWALALTAIASDRRGDLRGMGNYLIGEGPETAGIRRYPYSADLTVNPHTFESIKISTEEHDVGEVWATMLWELFWTLVDAHGFDPDVYEGDGGNNLALQLVMDALPLHGCEPTFLDARQAIFDADTNLTGDANVCRLWLSFAKRGLGASASASTNPNNVSTASEAFDLPPACAVCGDVDDSTAFDLVDVARTRRARAGLAPALFAPEKCNTAGLADPADADEDGVPNDCQAADVDVMRAALSGLMPGISPVCGPAVGVFR
jgi:hypothetical protein